jgi:hypothetical protein
MILAMASQVSFHHNTDSLFFLYKSDLIVKRSYGFKDLLDINSPLMFLYYYIINLISDATNIPPETVLTLVSLMIIVICLSIISAILTNSLGKTTSTTMIITSLFLAFIFSGISFLQRDFIISLFVIIYCISFLRKSCIKSDLYHKIIIGFLLGFVLSLKPHYILIPIFLELFELSKFKRFYRPSVEIQGMSIGFLLSILVTHFLSPNYYNNLLSLGANYFYFTYYENTYIEFYTFHLFLLPLYRFIKINESQKKVYFMFTYLYISSFFIALLQRKGFIHHFFLTHVCIIVLLTIICIGLYNKFLRKSFILLYCGF